MRYLEDSGLVGALKRKIYFDRYRIATNVVLYTFYEHTHLHPRFLYVTLPALFAFEAAGAWLVIRKAFKGRRERGL